MIDKVTIRKLIMLFSTRFFTVTENENLITKNSRTVNVKNFPLTNQNFTLQLMDAVSQLNKVTFQGSSITLSTASSDLYPNIKINHNNTTTVDDRKTDMTLTFKPGSIISSNKNVHAQYITHLNPHKFINFCSPQNPDKVYEILQDYFDPLPPQTKKDGKAEEKDNQKRNKNIKKIIEAYNEEIFDNSLLSYILDIFSIKYMVTSLGKKTKKMGHIELGSFKGGVFSTVGGFNAFPLFIGDDFFSNSKALLVGVGQYSDYHWMGIKFYTTLYKVKFNSYELLESTKVIPYLIFKINSVTVGMVGVIDMNYGDDKFAYIYNNLEDSVKLMDRINYNIPLFINFKKFQDLQLEVVLSGKIFTLTKIVSYIKMNLYQQKTTKLNFLLSYDYNWNKKPVGEDKMYGIKFSLEFSWKDGLYTYTFKLSMPNLIRILMNKYYTELNPFNPKFKDEDGKYLLPVISLAAKYDGAPTPTPQQQQKEIIPLQLAV